MARSSWRWIGVFLFLAAVVWPAQSAWAQRNQVTMGVPFRSVNDNFFERNGFGANIRGPGFFVNLGGFPLAIPQFGGFQPGAGATGGFAFGRGGINGTANFEFSQGNRRSNVSQVPLITLTDGAPGIFSDTTQSPFVIQVRPAGNELIPWKQQLRGHVPMQRRPKDRGPRRTLTTARAEPPAWGDTLRGQTNGAGDAVIQSVADIRRGREAKQQTEQKEVTDYVRRAEQAVREEKIGVAKIYYKMAAQRASGELKRQLLEKLSGLTD